MANRFAKLARSLRASHTEPEALYEALVSRGCPPCVAREQQNMQDRALERLDEHAQRNAHAKAISDRRKRDLELAELTRRNAVKQPPYTPFPGFADNVSKTQVEKFMTNLVGDMLPLPKRHATTNTMPKVLQRLGSRGQ